jgi:hypothetical protein
MKKLHLYTVFHCNLAFSMIPEEHFKRVIERCYRPVLRLAEEGVPVGIEMSAWTLREVNKLDPGFVERLRALWKESRCEFIGSGFSQAIFPLIPVEVNRWNLEAGNRVYEELLGRTPTTALVNEQTYSRGLADLYAKAGYDSIIMDWNNCFQHNLYPGEYRYFPQRAGVEGPGSGINVIWSNSIAFQKFQRCVHNEITEDEYLEYLFSNHSEEEDRAFVLYCNDAEVFDFRPGRDIEPEGEYQRIAELLKRIGADERAALTTPGGIIGRFRGSTPGEGSPDAFNAIALESAEMPVVCKKQGKYNPVRWAVAGRDSAHINTECYKVYENISALIKGGGGDAVPDETMGPLKETLCYLWGSDFRTNTIDEKFFNFHKKLGWIKSETERLLEARVLKSVPLSIAVGDGMVSGPEEEDGECANGDECCARTKEPHECTCGPVGVPQEAPGGGAAVITSDESLLKVSTGTVDVEFLVKKGYALKAVTFPGVSEAPLIGTLAHGYYDDMRLGADFFSGHLIHLTRDGRKATDLNGAVHEIEETSVAVTVRLKVPIEIGALWKVYEISKTEPKVSLTYRLKVNGLVSSSLRLGIFTMLPTGFDRDTLWYEAKNGGEAPDRFLLKGHDIAHDEPVSASVSASGCLGATDGTVRIGDSQKCVTIHTDKSKFYSVPMLRFRDLGGSFFLRLYHSIGEVDDTAWWVWRGYNEITFSITAHKI